MFIGSILTILLLCSEIIMKLNRIIGIKRVIIFLNSLFYKSINVEKTLSLNLNFDWVNSVINSYSFTRQILTWKLKHHQQFFYGNCSCKDWFSLKKRCRIPNGKLYFFYFCIDQILYHKHPSIQYQWKGI